MIAEQTSLAEKEAALTAKRLESEVRRPADAEAYKQRTLAEAARDSTKLGTEAEANRRRALAEADAEAERVTASAGSDAVKLKAEGDTYAARAIAQADAEAINARAAACHASVSSLPTQRRDTPGTRPGGISAPQAR